MNFENPVTGEGCLVDRSAAPLGDKDTATVEEYGCRDVVFRSYNNEYFFWISSIKLYA